MSNDPLLESLVHAADEKGRIEFRSYGDLKLAIRFEGAVRQLKREVSALYNSDSRRIYFKSRMRRQLENDPEGSKTKHLIIVPQREVDRWRRKAVMSKLPQSVPFGVARDIALEDVFGVDDAKSVLAGLVEEGLVRCERTPGTKGKVYERFVLA